MISRLTALHVAVFLLVAGCLHRSQAQESPVIRTESRVVLVDAVVTDKKGNYVRDLKQKDFKVWEDNKEQTVTSFTFEADAASPANDRKHYLVLFFDNSTSSPQDQIHAREAASKFIDSNAGKNRLMAVVEFSGGLHVSQNFTDDADRLKKVVAGVKFSSLSPNQGPASLRSFSSRSVLLALRDLSKSLASVSGRKTLVFISGGFPLDSEGYSELTATIDACNRANVAVYPIDLRGLVAPGSAGPRASLEFPALNTSAWLQPASFQSKGGSRGGGSSGSSGSSGSGSGSGSGSRAGSGSASSARPPAVNPNSGPRTIVPPLSGVAGNQQVLYALASGTGGFVIVNTNDLLSGMEKIGKEQNEFYLLGYTPSKELEPGACHTIKVKVDQGGTTVRARSGYCDVKPKDILAGTPTERSLENRANGTAAPTIKASMQAPFLYVAPGIARVDMAMDLPAGAMSLAKEKGKFQVSMSVIGIVSSPDGGVAARFSDQVKRDFEEKKQAEAFQQLPYRYQKQFEVASGTYNLKVVFSSSADNFGKLEAPLVVEPYDSKQFLVSGLVLSKDAHTAGAGGLGAASAALEDRVPLIVNNIEITPAGTNHFLKTERGIVYGEIYEPAFLAEEIKNPPAVGIQLQMVERKTGSVKFDSGLIRLDPKPQPGIATVPFGLKLDFSALAAGSYQVRVTAIDSAEHKFVREAGLELDGN